MVRRASAGCLLGKSGLFARAKQRPAGRPPQQSLRGREGRKGQESGPPTASNRAVSLPLGPFLNALFHKPVT